MSGRTLFLIPARGGSKRIPGKNLRSLAGHPARGLGRPDRSGCRGARGTTRRLLDGRRGDRGGRLDLGAAGRSTRPAELATDTATSIDVALHALDAAAGDGEPIDLLALVQPTSPLTDPADLRAAIDLARETGRSVASVTASHPAAWHHAVGGDDGLQAGGRRGCRPPAHRRVLRDDAGRAPPQRPVRRSRA